ncbi:hypothetical protein Bca101_051029 [Brassica carinata]
MFQERSRTCGAVVNKSCHASPKPTNATFDVDSGEATPLDAETLCRHFCAEAGEMRQLHRRIETEASPAPSMRIEMTSIESPGYRPYATLSPTVTESEPMSRGLISTRVTETLFLARKLDCTDADNAMKPSASAA